VLTLDNHLKRRGRQSEWCLRDPNADQRPQRPQHLHALLIYSLAVSSADHCVGAESRCEGYDSLDDVDLLIVQEACSAQ